MSAPPPPPPTVTGLPGDALGQVLSFEVHRGAVAAATTAAAGWGV